MTTDLRTNLELRLARDGHKNPQEGATRIIQILEIISHEELDKDCPETTVGPFKFTETVMEHAVTQDARYNMIHYEKIKYTVCVALKLKVNQFEQLFTDTTETGLLRLKKEGAKLDWY